MVAKSPNVLIVGVGSIGERHARCFHAAGVDVSICDTNGELLQAVAGRCRVAASYTSLDDALAHPFDLAVIATPADTHLPLALTCVRAGISLLIEKPLSVSLDGVEELQNAVNSQELTAATAYVYRAHPALAAMREAIDTGRFGRPLQVVAVAGQHFPTYRPAYREIYYRRRETGGGAVQDALTHIVNAAEWLVGPADRVVGDAARLRLDGVEVEDTVHAAARHGEVLASYSLNQHQSPNECTITVVCERGTARFEYHACRWRSINEPDGNWQEEHFGVLERDELFVRQARDTLAAVAGRHPPLCSLAEGIQTLRFNLALLQSIDEQRWVDIA